MRCECLFSVIVIGIVVVIFSHGSVIIVTILIMIFCGCYYWYC